MVRDDPRDHPLAREDRVDRLVETGRDDQGIVGFHELAEPGSHPDVLEHPFDDLVERRRDRRHLPGDHLVERHPAELAFEGVEHREVAEALDHHVERVPLGDRSVPIEDERQPLCGVRRQADT